MKIKEKIPYIIIIIISLTIMFLAIFFGLKDKKEYEENSTFIKVETGINWIIVYNKNTKIMYVVSDGNRNKGIFTMLTDENGKPLLWKE